MEVMLLSSPFRLLIQDFVEQLATSGIDLIEIGHGLGLNGFSHPSVSKYKCESDESHNFRKGKIPFDGATMGRDGIEAGNFSYFGSNEDN